MSGERFEVNGVWYDSIDEVPQPYRDSIAAMLSDRDGDGVPDLFAGSGGSHHVVMHTESYEVDGVTYGSLDDVPEPQRSHVRRALGATDSAAQGPGGRPALVDSGRPSPIVTSAGLSSRAKLLIAFIAFDLAVVAGVIYIVTR